MENTDKEKKIEDLTAEELEGYLKKEFPGINYAYDIAIKSYELTSNRSDAIDGRINRFLTWSTSITAGIIAVYTSINKYNLEFNKPFYIAVAIFCVILITAFLLELFTKVELISPGILRDHDLFLNEYTFKRDRIFAATKAFDKDLKRINCKGRFSV
jgi:hypothetical protein